MKVVLKNKLFMLTLFADLLSNFGDVVYYLAFMTYVLELKESATALSLIAFLGTIPTITSVLSGHLADNIHDKIRWIKITQLFRVGIYLVIGLLMGFKPALWVVVVAQLLSLLASFSGQLESGLYIPLSLRVVSDEDREAAMGFRYSLSSTLNLVSQGIAAVLLSFWTYQLMAFANAGTFLASFIVMSILTPSYLTLLKDRPLVVKTSEVKEGRHLLGGFWRNIKESTKVLISISEIRPILVVIPIINGIFSILNLLLTLLMSQDKAFIVISPAFTLSVVTIGFSIGTILGGLAVSFLFKKSSYIHVMAWSTSFSCLTFLGLWLHNPYLVFVAQFLAGVVSGIVNPKFQAFFYRTFSEEEMATLEGGMSTFFQSGTILFRTAFSGVMLWWSVDVISVGLLLLCLLLLGYTLSKLPRGKGKHEVPIS
ncbi:MFS transporter [Streptococcus sp. S784/96/1]|uniref:MFS transporter n=1 Tax=Streptococcus sp. S784/96/1 TaxID=2653499 RepID=UPI001386E138|nr:MFS transporter [Streptococcus sp. S784/96/1]